MAIRQLIDVILDLKVDEQLIFRQGGMHSIEMLIRKGTHYSSTFIMRSQIDMAPFCLLGAKAEGALRLLRDAAADAAEKGEEE